jgi:hypothetical protein
MVKAENLDLVGIVQQKDSRDLAARYEVSVSRVHNAEDKLKSGEQLRLAEDMGSGSLRERTDYLVIR